MSRRRAALALSLCALAAAAMAPSSCAPSGFADPVQIVTVRILASAADKPYAKPGDTVTVSVLAYDGRPVKPEPMTIYWLPLVCENPADDAYYACFAQIAGGGGTDGGAAAAPSAGLKPGVDLTPFLPVGPSYTFKMPADAVTSHPVIKGEGTPYGLAIVFNIACAGHLEIVPYDHTNPQSPPIACFDSSHNVLGPKDWVLGLSRVFAYDTLTNANPVITALDVAGQTVEAGAPAPHAVNDTVDVQRCTGNCPKIAFGPIVPPSSQETQSQLAGGSGQKEELWADFYSTFGSFDTSSRLLYDSAGGSIGGPSVTDDPFQPPSDPGDGLAWIVVHDNRGGASWITVPIHVE